MRTVAFGLLIVSVVLVFASGTNFSYPTEIEGPALFWSGVILFVVASGLAFASKRAGPRRPQ